MELLQFNEKEPVNVCKLFSIQNDIEWQKLFVINTCIHFKYSIRYTIAYIMLTICLRNQFIYRQKCHILSYLYYIILTGHLRLLNMCTQDYFHPTFVGWFYIERKQLYTTYYSSSHSQI